MFGNGYYNNPLAQYLNQYIPQDNNTTAPAVNKPVVSVTAPYEVNSQAELEYIEPDKSGRKQIVDCPAENKLYVGRYNHTRANMDWKVYVEEKDIVIKQGDSGEDLRRVAEALLLLTNKVETIQTDIQELKLIPKVEQQNSESNRGVDGKFVKKGTK